MPKEEDRFYMYQKVPEVIEKKLSDLSKDAYLACFGTGYGRVDIRSNVCDLSDPNF
jgi:D-alanine-D-alanine ligase-like ATP-grasp enzyme